MANRRKPQPGRRRESHGASGDGTGGSSVWVSWGAADGPKSTQGELQALDDCGFVRLTIAGGDTLWIPHARVFSISTGPERVGSALEQTAVEAAAVIQAVAEATAPE